MSPVRSDDDLAELLRVTLERRADHIASGPRWTDQIEARRRRVWIAPLAAAVAVAALACVFVVLRTQHNDEPPSSRRPSVDLTGFTVGGYPTSARRVERGSRSVVVSTESSGRPRSDVIVWVFNPTVYRFRGFHRLAGVMIGGHPGYSGTAPLFNQGLQRNGPTVVWNFAPDSWAMVQPAARSRTPSVSTLIKVAEAARPTEHIAITTSFTLGYVPPGYHVFGAREVESPREVTIFLRGPALRTLSVTQSPLAVATGSDGVDLLRHGGTVLDIEVTERHGGGSTPADTATATRVRQHVVWESSTLDRVVP
jgi:hypothetical protein